MREARSLAPLRRLRGTALDLLLSPRNGLRLARLAPTLVLIVFFFLGPGCGRGGRDDAARPMIGVKIYEASPPFDGLFRLWRELGINTLFVSEALLVNGDFRARARTNGLALFLIYPVFQGPEALKADPGLAAITASGEPARDEWVEFVCPTKGDEFLEHRIDRLRSLVAVGRPDVVSFDFIRYFVFWEKVAPDRAPNSLPQTCFCPLCMRLFQNEFGVEIPADLAGTAGKAKWILEAHAEEWAEWKCQRIARTVERLTAAARQADPGVKVNLHFVPWRKGDFGGAVRSVAGQDAALLAPLADYLSPMAYHHMVRQTPAWVHDVVEDLSAQAGGTLVLPSIQVAEAYITEPLAAAEFEAALEQALRPPSKGVVLWSWDALSKSPEKMKVLRSLAGLKK